MHENCLVATVFSSIFICSTVGCPFLKTPRTYTLSPFQSSQMITMSLVKLHNVAKSRLCHAIRL